MKNNNEDEKLDRVLDEIASGLRDEKCPPMPDELFSLAHEPVADSVALDKKFRYGKRVWWLAQAAALIGVATLIGVLWFGDAENLNKARPSLTTTGIGEIAVQNLASLQPYASVEKEITEMEKEITQLKKEVKLLDAYRKANSLMAQN